MHLAPRAATLLRLFLWALSQMIPPHGYRIRLLLGAIVDMQRMVLYYSRLVLT